MALIAWNPGFAGKHLRLLERGMRRAVTAQQLAASLGVSARMDRMAGFTCTGEGFEETPERCLAAYLASVGAPARQA